MHDDAAPVAVVEVTVVEVELPSLTQRIDWVDDWEEKTREARRLSRLDRQYYDNVQWTSEEVDKLKERKQPILTKNRIARKINFIRGEEIKKRVDPACYPRTPQHEDAARAATDALRFVEEEQDFDHVRSAVLLNVLVEGMGGALKEVEQNDDGTFAHRLRHVEWDRLLYDPHSRASDFSDAKYLGLVVWMDLDDAVIDYPDVEDELQSALAKDIGGHDDTTEDVPRRWADRKRKRVKIVELYFRVGKDWYRSIFTHGADLEEPARTVYLDEKKQRSVCPLKMVSCHVDSECNRYGVVRPLISPQDEINKRSSKALHLLSVRSVVAERDSVRDPDKFMAELAKPDGFAEVEPGRLADGSVQIQSGAELAGAQLSLLQEAKADIDTIGPSSATLPEIPASSSGRAFMARQQAASQELGPVFDALRRWTKQIFELDWLCIRQFWTEEKWLRVTDDQELNGYRFAALNRKMTRATRMQELMQKQVPLPKALETAAGDMAPLISAIAQQQVQALGQVPPGQQQQALVALILRHPMMQEMITENQVEQMQVDIVIDEAPETAIIEQEEFSKLTEFAGMVVPLRPDMAPLLAKMIVKASQLRNKREILQELEKPPDQQQAQMQQQQQQLAMAQAQAGVQATQSMAQLNAAKAASEQAKTQIAGAKTPSEIEKNQASAMRDAAHAGATAGGTSPHGVA